MNQILQTKSKKSIYKKFITIFILSMVIILILLIIYIVNLIQYNKEKNFSEYISKNYKVYKLYANDNTNSFLLNDEDIIGNISIPKLNLNYPFFYGISDELLKLSPCRFQGEMPPAKSNLCIAGHNYNDNRFFSQISNLSFNDLIIIENNSKNKFYYYVDNIYEVSEENLNFTVNSVSNYLELTLITCNNSNNKRIVVKAKTESLY